MSLRSRANHSAWPNLFLRLCEPVFIPVKGRIFVTFSRSKRVIKSIKDLYRRKEPKTIDENTSNHEHVTCFPGETLANIQKNYTLAESIQLIWEHKLTSQYPGRKFRILVVNEYDLSTTGDSTDDKAIVTCQDVTTTLRVWTIDPSTTRQFDAAYHVQDLSYDKAIWPGQWEYGIDVGVLDLKRVCDIIRKAKRKTMTLGNVKREFLRARQV